MKQLINIATTLATVLFSVIAWADVEVNHGYVRATPPGANNSAAFMRLYNSNEVPVRLIRATSDAAKDVELHGHASHNGTMQMRPVDAIRIDAGSHQALTPNGYHIMLIGLTRDLKPDTSVEMTLHFSDGSRTVAELPVTRINANNKPGHQHHSEQHHHSHQAAKKQGHQH